MTHWIPQRGRIDGFAGVQPHTMWSLLNIMPYYRFRV